jgi:hypothetical protein
LIPNFFIDRILDFTYSRNEHPRLETQKIKLEIGSIEVMFIPILEGRRKKHPDIHPFEYHYPRGHIHIHEKNTHEENLNSCTLHYKR